MEVLTARLGGMAGPTLPAAGDAAQARRAGAALFRYAIAATSGDGARAEALMREVSRLVPDVVASAARESTAGDLADGRRTLRSLRGEQERLPQQLQSLAPRLPATRARRRSGAAAERSP